MVAEACRQLAHVLRPLPRSEPITEVATLFSQARPFYGYSCLTLSAEVFSLHTLEPHLPQDGSYGLRAIL